MVTFDQEKIQIAVPEGALDTETQFTYLSYSSLAYSTGGMGYAGISFQLTAQQTVSGDPVTTFDLPLQVTVHYDPVSLGDLPEESLRLYFWDADGAAWQDVVTTCSGGDYDRNFDQNWFSVPLCHLSEFAVLGETPSGETGYSIYLPLIMK
jgi:hypothetical protein